jgi:hypothetical protein
MFCQYLVGFGANKITSTAVSILEVQLPFVKLFTQLDLREFSTCLLRYIKALGQVRMKQASGCLPRPVLGICRPHVFLKNCSYLFFRCEMVFSLPEISKLP